MVYSSAVIFVFGLLLFVSILEIRSEVVIDDFRSAPDTSGWFERSDTVLPQGASKSSFVIQKTQRYQRAILFTLLNPLHCGAGLAGISKNVSLDLSNSHTILLNVSNQGEYNGYEFFLRHKGDTGVHVSSYVKYFQAPQNRFEVVSLPLEEFKPYSKGKLLREAEPLDTSNITSVGLLTYGGIHSKNKQRGVASLEIDWIKVV